MTRLYLSLGSLLLVAVAIALILREPLSPDRRDKTRPFAIRVSETSGSLVVEWDPQSRLVQSASGGRLEYVDGGMPHSDQVDARVLRQGGLEYRRRSDDVLLRLVLLQGRDVIGNASVRLTGSPAPPSATPVTTR